MEGLCLIDTSFDVRSDAGGADPDSHSGTLRCYHRLLWSKPLPDGSMFDLDASLHHKSALGEYWLSSDSIVHTYSRWVRPASLVEVVGKIPPAQITAFYNLACTVGAYIVFPVRVDADGQRRMSVNQARGIHPKIRDRFDLTLECIRRHYEGTASPLTDRLAPYAGFFHLFGGFAGYVEHFLLDDLVEGRSRTDVRFLADFDDFTGSALPAGSVTEYREYMQRSMDFIRARNRRIAAYASRAPTV